MKHSAVLVLAATSLVAVRLRAQPSGEPPEKAKARTLLKEGVRLLDAGQLSPALRKFEDAYAAFPSAKILINIGTAQSGLGQWADAANTYQRYLESGVDDPVQLPAVTQALAELDVKLSRLALRVRGADRSIRELRIAGRAWLPLPPSGLVRVEPGRFDVQVRASAGEHEVTASGTIAAREEREVVFDLDGADTQHTAATTPPMVPMAPPAGDAADTQHTAATTPPMVPMAPRAGDGVGTQRTVATAPLMVPMMPSASDAADTQHTAATTPPMARRAPPAIAPSSRAPRTLSADRTSAAHTPAVAADAGGVEGIKLHAPGESPQRRSRWTPLRQGAVVAGAIGSAGLIAMTVLALDARSMWNHAQPEKDLELARRAAMRASFATGAGVLGVAALGTGIVLWFVGAPNDREPPAVTAIADDKHVGFVVQGAF